MKHLPFYLTLSRIVGAPLLLLPFIANTEASWWFCVILFIALSITDYYDGKLARKYNVVSNFGKFFDPTGDKILVLFSLVILTHFKQISPFFIIILLSRDILIGSIRAYGSAEGIVLPARALGKFKTVLQMIALPTMMLPESFLGLFLKLHIDLFLIGNLILWAACAVSLISLWDYMIQLKNGLSSVDKNKV